ncbi:MAG: hypothetical protein AAFY65_07105 [Pseudomonadota bacterium]
MSGPALAAGIALMGVPKAVIAAGLSAAPDVEIILKRQYDSLEIFVSTQADKVGPVLGGHLAGLINETGYIPFNDMLRNGSTEFGESMMSQTTMRVDGDLVLVEATSFMAHPPELDLPFEIPFDAEVATSVCAAEEPDRTFVLADLTTFAGYIAYPVDGYASIEIDLGGPADAQVLLSVFDGETLVARDTVNVTGDTPLVVRAGGAHSYLPLFVSLALMALGAAAGFGGHLYRQRLLSRLPDYARM